MPRCTIRADNLWRAILLAEDFRFGISGDVIITITGQKTKMRYLKILLASGALVSALFFTGCATETSRAVETPQVQAASQHYSGPKVLMAVAPRDRRPTQ